MSFQVVQVLLGSGPALFANAAGQSSDITDDRRNQDAMWNDHSGMFLKESIAFGIMGTILDTALYAIVKVVDKFPRPAWHLGPGPLMQNCIINGAFGLAGVALKISQMKDIWENHNAGFNTKRKVQRAALDGAILYWLFRSSWISCC